MPYARTRDLLDQLSNLHGKMGRLYSDLGGRAEKETARMLLEYMSRHEKRLEDSLRQYTDDAAGRILDTWFQFPPDFTESRNIADLDLGSDVSIEQVVKTVLEFDERLIKFFQHLSETAASTEVKDLFSSLVTLEQYEEQEAMRSALEM